MNILKDCLQKTKGIFHFPEAKNVLFSPEIIFYTVSILRYNQKEGEKIEELIKAAREELRRKKKDIVMASTDEHDCVENMELGVDEFVKNFVDADEFLKVVPEEVLELKAELDREFRKAYNEMFNDKLADLKKATKEALLKKKDGIVLQASSEEDCVDIMKEEVDAYVRAYVKKDKFFKEVPTGIIPEIQDELEPIFREAYVT